MMDVTAASSQAHRLKASTHFLQVYNQERERSTHGDPVLFSSVTTRLDRMSQSVYTILQERSQQLVRALPIHHKRALLAYRR